VPQPKNIIGLQGLGKSPGFEVLIYIYGCILWTIALERLTVFANGKKRSPYLLYYGIISNTIL
jgi:hypothetical protein